MSREELLREYYAILCRMQDRKRSVLIGTQVSLPRYGSGIITFQNQSVTRVLLGDEEKSFYSSAVGESFRDEENDMADRDTFNRLQKRLDLTLSPLQLIQKLVDNWSDWDQYEDLYLNEVAPSLVGTTHWPSCDAPMLKPLKELLSPEDWTNLPKYIADVHFGRTPHFINPLFRDDKIIESEICTEFRNNVLRRTEEILEKIVNHEIAEEKRSNAISTIERLFQKDYSLAEEYFHSTKNESGLSEDAFYSLYAEFIQTTIKQLLHDDYFKAEEYYHSNLCASKLSESEFRSLRNHYVQTWFEENPGRSRLLPDEHQVAAISACEKNVEVVARAGSGKTATIVNRFRFLTEHCHVDPSAILILAFNKKAVEELNKKIKKQLSPNQDLVTKMPHIMTLHALAYSIVHPSETLIYDDDAAGSKVLSQTIQSIIDKRLRSIVWVTKIRSVMLSHFKDDWAVIDAGKHYLTKEELLLYRRSLPNLTLKGEYVKSFGEKAIANVLFEHNVEYKYEKAFSLVGGEYYRPDFTISAPGNRQIIIEYFGLAGDPTYDQQIQWKRDYWARKKDIRLVELYPSDIDDTQHSLTAKLLSVLSENKIAYRRLSEDEIWKKIKDRAIDHFTETVKSFIARCRKKDLSSNDLMHMISEYPSAVPAESKFLEIAHSIYDEYLKTLKNDKLEDFDGLISRASQCIQEGKHGFDKRDNRGNIAKLSFIMIDEYQDFSFLFDRFLDSIRSACPNASIFCVGDDWQAINAFAGSDVYYFNQFTNRYDKSRRYYLRTNYRSKQEIVSAGTRLMSKGETNFIRAANQGGGIIRLGYLSKFPLSPVEISHPETDVMSFAVLRLISSILKQGEEKRVVILTRTNDRIPFSLPNQTRGESTGTSQERFLTHIRSFFRPEERKRITASTTHKYKGEEEDTVIILDALFSYYPLIHPTWFFQRVFGDTVEKLVEEEKRLFYVAVSRAKNNLFILTNKNEESPYISGLGNLQPINWDEYPPLKPGKEAIKLEVYSQPGFGANPTIAIKETLKVDYGYAWDRFSKRWVHYYPANEFDIAQVLSQSWTQKANHVVLVQHTEGTQEVTKYLFEDGKVIQIDN